MTRRILIADDHFAIRRGIKHFIESQLTSVEFGETSTAFDTLQRLKEKQWDLLILDIEVPGRNGFDVLKQIKAEAIKTPVLVFSFYPEDQLAVRTLRAGQQGMFLKMPLTQNCWRQ